MSIPLYPGESIDKPVMSMKYQLTKQEQEEKEERRKAMNKRKKAVQRAKKKG